MNSAPIAVDETPKVIDGSLTDGTTYSIQNRSPVFVYLIQKDSAPNTDSDFDAVTELYPREHPSGAFNGSIKPKAGFSIYAWTEGGEARVVLNEA